MLKPGKIYEEIYENFRWEIPKYYNIGVDICDKWADQRYRLALDTDGTDGPTDVAGGLIDNSTVKRARETNLNILKHLSEHDASTALLSLGDAIITGSTGTNVNDLKILVGDI